MSEGDTITVVVFSNLSSSRSAQQLLWSRPHNRDYLVATGAYHFERAAVEHLVQLASRALVQVLGRLQAYLENGPLAHPRLAHRFRGAASFAHLAQAGK